MVDFLQSVIPIRFRQDKQLVSHNIHTSSYNYKFTYSVEIVPICRVRPWAPWKGYSCGGGERGGGRSQSHLIHGHPPHLQGTPLGSMEVVLMVGGGVRSQSRPLRGDTICLQGTALVCMEEDRLLWCWPTPLDLLCAKPGLVRYRTLCFHQTDRVHRSAILPHILAGALRCVPTPKTWWCRGTLTRALGHHCLVRSKNRSDSELKCERLISCKALCRMTSSACPHGWLPASATSTRWCCARVSPMSSPWWTPPPSGPYTST